MYLHFYAKHEKKFFVIPMVLLLVSIFIVVNHYLQTGDIFDKDVSLKGGISATVYTMEDAKTLEAKLADSLKADVSVRKLAEFGTEKQTGLLIEVSDVDRDTLKKAISSILKIELTYENFSMEETGSSLGRAFYSQMARAMILAFIFMAIVVFITFRTPIPSLAVILCAFSDIVTTIAFINVIGMKVSTSGIAALLLLIGYSVDTDILMTTRVWKRKEGAIMQRFFDSMETGLTMTATALVAVTLGYFLSNSYVLQQMFLVLGAGLVADVFYTYMQNGRILLWYVHKKEKVTNG
ncbi:protein translocase subunit SecF [Candidatus Woesearchaeota archaeon]|nr:protein translocase subunit SecF [Candidatus Woesearchaeota archaeon]